MAVHEWGEVESDLFPPGDEDRVSVLEEELRAQVRAYKLADPEVPPSDATAGRRGSGGEQGSR